MKFGKYLEAEQVPEWEKMYVNYRALKRLIKKIALAKEARVASPSEEKTSLLRRASAYLGYNSIIPGDNSSNNTPARATGSATINSMPEGLSSPPPVFSREHPMSGSSTSCQRTVQLEEPSKNGKDIFECCSDASCATCNHFNSIVSATPQLALSMSAANSGKVGATPMDLAHCANIKLPMSAQDSFSEAARRRKTPVASDCVSLDEFQSELKERMPEEQDFFEKLEQELSKVNDFYKQKQALFQSRLDNIKRQQDIYDTMLGEELEASTLNASIERSRVTFNRTLTSSSISRHRQHAFEPSAQLRAAKGKLKRAMLEIYRGMDLLKNYRVLCYTAFIKALKKYQKTAVWCRGTDHFLNRVDGCYIATSERLNAMSAELE
ncbi:hypothetical protein GGI23_005803, partial [Coemansia sp. RSA 2559]